MSRVKKQLFNIIRFFDPSHANTGLADSEEEDLMQCTNGRPHQDTCIGCIQCTAVG